MSPNRELGCFSSPTPGQHSGDEPDFLGLRCTRRLTADQTASLEEEFAQDRTLNQSRRNSIAERLGLETRQVDVWFQNKRAKIRVRKARGEVDLLKRSADEQRDRLKRLSDLNKELEEQLHSFKRHRADLKAHGASDVSCPSLNIGILQQPTPTQPKAAEENGWDLLGVVKSNGRFMNTSAAVEHMLQYTAEELRSMTIYDMLYPEDRSASILEQVLWGIILAVQIRLRLRARNGEDVWVTMKANAMNFQGQVCMGGFVKRLPIASAPSSFSFSV
mmetsp:Transcript_42346/g.68674  ORF Transcript_42346/g.68674 Transcript_42346/m.68674 type:complete len:275 (-) Transcript_42346:973-1797(-)|eukprot:CAMPEP_0184657144 /NCGR_PEP_ID=MMETSP0308-20130426/17009_1 /TAXON_ID=38269 /ORGANISM="Gloeochaete witrockiana, Strain SAG 46.84" /LENGTH=274 /DNA_ID=CAMNT_0027094573 /DNA_START=137 /DNA_END=961 /DNA_ORIENTATION=-